MKKGFFHDDGRMRLRDHFLYVSYMVYFLLTLFSPHNRKFHRKLAEVRDRIRELKTIKLQTDL